MTTALSLDSTALPSPVMTATGTPRLLLRLEGLVMLLVAVAGYRALGGAWGTFAACFLLPDLSMLGYLGGPRVGAALYNAGHSLMGPLMLAVLGTANMGPGFFLAALLWTAHIGFDRAAGYGLKYANSFFDTHLGRVGKDAHG